MEQSSCFYNNDPLLINEEAKLNLLVYEDYECECCGKAFKELKVIREYFKENVCVVYKHFPCAVMHPSALLAALVAEASVLQQKFIEVHDTIFELQSFLEYGLGGILGVIEKRFSISIKQLMEDIEKPTVINRVDDDIECGKQMGVKNTPAIFINNTMYKGLVKFNELSKTIRQQILKVNSELQIENS